MFSMSKKTTGKSKGRSEIRDLSDALPDSEIEQATGGAVSQQVAMGSPQLRQGTVGTIGTVGGPGGLRPPHVAPTTW
jgi:hypothetical protein